MSRLTIRYNNGNVGVKSPLRYYNYQDIKEILEKLAHYEDLEEQLEELFGGKLPLDKVVETLKRTVQNGEENLDYARILTNAEAEKWDKWKDLEEQDRLIELPCKVGDTVWRIVTQQDNYDDSPYKIVMRSSFRLDFLRAMGDRIFTTKEEAEAKLEELNNE